MRLIRYEGYNLTIEPELLTIKPFKKIWTRDKSKTKERALLELAYIYFMVDFRSDYQMYVDTDEREKQIKEGEGLPESWKPDSEVLEAMEYYSKFKPIASLLLEDTKYAVSKVRTLLREIDLKEVDDKGRPVYTIDKILSAIKQVPTIVKDLEEAERAIAKEIIASDKVRGSQTKSMFEDD